MLRAFKSHQADHPLYKKYFFTHLLGVRHMSENNDEMEGILSDLHTSG